MRKAKNTTPSLENQKSDITASLARAGLGALPGVGSLLSEVATSLIPNQRMDRLVDFARILDEKFKNLDKSFIRSQLTDENFVDILEEGMIQAAKSLSKERRKYIALVITHGLSDKEIEFVETRRFLKLLGELNDVEIIILRYYLHPTIGGDEKFRKKHEKIIKVQRATVRAPQTVVDKETTHNAYKEHLVSSNLLKKKYSTDITGQLKLDSFTKSPEASGYSITLFGKLFLRQVGLA